MLESYRLTFYKYTGKGGKDKRIAAAMVIEAYNESCANAMAEAILDNLPNNWFYEVERV